MEVTRKVLVLDAELSTMLAVIRSLSKYGVKVMAISNGKRGGYVSKYCWMRIDFSDIPSYAKFDAVGKVIEIEKIDAIFAHLESTIFSVWDVIHKIHTDARVISPPRNILEFVTNKYEILKFADKLNIKIPKTEVVTPDTLEDRMKDFTFPIFVKTLKEIDIPPGPGNRYIILENIKDLPKFEEFVKKHKKVIVQEYIEGFGCGIGGLFYNGKPVAVGGHKRIRESFKTGGPSTFAVSYIHKEALEYALKLMRKLKYTGFGMVEFKIDKNGEPYLMEINPRIWGTFPLYIKSGLDLPVLAYKLFVEEDKSILNRDYLEGFREGIKMIYLFKDIESVIEQYSNKLQKFETIIKDFLYLLFSRSVSESLLELKDLKPFIWDILIIIRTKFGSRLI